MHVVAIIGQVITMYLHRLVVNVAIIVHYCQVRTLIETHNNIQGRIKMCSELSIQ